GLDEIAVAGQEERRALVEHDQHRFESPQDAVAAPVLRELDGRALEVPAELFELGLESREQREGVRRRPGESGQNPIVVQPPDLLRPLLDDRLPEGDLPVTGENSVITVSNGQNGRAVNHRYL